MQLDPSHYLGGEVVQNLKNSFNNSFSLVLSFFIYLDYTYNQDIRMLV